MKPLRISLYFLSVLLVGLVICYLCAVKIEGYEWLKDISLNLGTEVFGILLTVWLIDAVIRKNEEKERERLKILIAVQSRIPLLHLAILLLKIYKASLPQAHTSPPLTFKELFGPDFTKQLAFFDFTKPAPVTPARPWFQYINEEFNKFNSSLSETAAKYAFFMEVEALELMEELQSAPLTRLMALISGIIQSDRENNFNRPRYTLFAGPDMAEAITTYTDLFQKLIDRTNLRLSDNNKIGIQADLWRQDISPQFGSAR